LMEKHLRTTSEMVETVAGSPLGKTAEIGGSAKPWNGSYASSGEANGSLR
jgi:hypothetical protein